MKVKETYENQQTMLSHQQSMNLVCFKGWLEITRMEPRKRQRNPNHSPKQTNSCQTYQPTFQSSLALFLNITMSANPYF